MNIVTLARANACEPVAQRGGILVEECALTSQEVWARVTVAGRARRQKPTVFNALFGSKSPLWKRVWISEGEGRLTIEEQESLRLLLATSSPRFARSSASSFVDLLANFLAPDTALENFDAQTQGARWQADFSRRWTMICEFIGHPRVATYTLRDSARSTRSSTWIVGDPESGCRGRCGFGCGQAIPQWRSKQYTQECLNHDACHSETGAQLGVCASAFWSATASYLFAPNCG